MSEIELVRNILLVPKGFIGDLVLTSPVIEAIKRDNPSARLCVLVTPNFAEYIRRDVHVDEVLVFDRHGEFSGWRGLKRFSQKIREKNFAVAYSFHRSPRTSVLLAMAGIPERVGYTDAIGAFLYTRRVPRTARCHEVIRNLELVRAELSEDTSLELARLQKAGPTPVTERFSLRVPDVSPDEVSVIVSGVMECHKPIVVLAPGSAWETKRWSASGYREIAREMVARGNRVVVVGSSADQDVCAEVCQDGGADVINLCGRTTLFELLFVIGGARAIVCNDSVALHIASARHTPTVVIFCATSPLFGFGPWKNRAVVVEKGDLFCKPCRRHGSHRCPTGTMACMKGVSTEMVMRAFVSLHADHEAPKKTGSFQVVPS